MTHINEAREALETLHSDSNDFWEGNKREAEVSILRAALTASQEQRQTISALKARVVRLDAEVNRLTDKGCIYKVALEEIDRMCPATCEMTLAHDMADLARQALSPEHEPSLDGTAQSTERPEHET